MKFKNKHFFGKYIAYAYTYAIELQKTGLHVHILIFLDKEYKLFNTAKVDTFIKVEIPDKSEYLRLYNLSYNGV